MQRTVCAQQCHLVKGLRDQSFLPENAIQGCSCKLFLRMRRMSCLYGLPHRHCLAQIVWGSGRAAQGAFYSGYTIIEISNIWKRLLWPLPENSLNRKRRTCYIMFSFFGLSSNNPHAAKEAFSKWRYTNNCIKSYKRTCCFLCFLTKWHWHGPFWFVRKRHELLKENK